MTFTHIVIVLFIITISLSFLQIKLSEKDSKALGLILPILFLICSTIGTYYFIHNFLNVVPLSLAIAIFLLCSIPTIVFTIIYSKVRYDKFRVLKQKEIHITSLDDKFK